MHLPVLFHISPRDRRDSILANGLVVGSPRADFGVPPERVAIYLYSEENVNMMYSMIHHFNDFDIWEVTLEDTDSLTDDEDARVGWGDWERSLDRLGTCAHLGDIPASQVTFLANVNRHL